MYDRDQVSGLDVYEYVHVHNSRQGWTHSIRPDFVRQDRDFDQQTTYSPGLKDQLRRPRLLTCEWFRPSCAGGEGGWNRFGKSWRHFRMADDMDSYDSFPINWIFETRHHLRGNASNPATSQWHNTKAGSTDKRHRNVMKLWSNRNEKTLTRRKSELGFINHKISKVKPMGWTSLLLIQLATLSEKAPGQWRQYKGAA
jgi:hypothetical protein